MTQESLDTRQWHVGLGHKVNMSTEWNKHVQERKSEREEEKGPTCTMLLMTWGSMLSGNLRMLNSESDTKAFSASRTLFSSTFTYTANVVNATWKHIKQTKPGLHDRVSSLQRQQPFMWHYTHFQINLRQTVTRHIISAWWMSCK